MFCSVCNGVGWIRVGIGAARRLIRCECNRRPNRVDRAAQRRLNEPDPCSGCGATFVLLCPLDDCPRKNRAA